MTIKEFEITFTGRKLGGIGITYPIKVRIQSLNKEDAYSEFIRLGYAKYEHISHVNVQEVQAKDA